MRDSDLALQPLGRVTGDLLAKDAWLAGRMGYLSGGVEAWSVWVDTRTGIAYTFCKCYAASAAGQYWFYEPGIDDLPEECQP